MNRISKYLSRCQPLRYIDGIESQEGFENREDDPHLNELPDVEVDPRVVARLLREGKGYGAAGVNQI